MTRPNVKTLMMGAAVFALVACSSLPSIPGFGGGNSDEQAAEDKAGRIAMVLEDEVLEANPELAATPIELPPAEPVTTWSQTGKVSSKVIGHVQAGGGI